jgi:hypothetical protein
MTRRLVGFGLLVAMAVLYVGITLPARRVRDESRTAFAQRREERERLRVDVARLERRASEVRVGTPDDAAAAARALRLSLLAATHGLGISDVQIASHPERRGTTAARGRLVGTGRQPDVLRTAGRLAHPDSGVLLERLELALRPEGIRMEADAVSVRAGSPPDDAPPPYGGGS